MSNPNTKDRSVGIGTQMDTFYKTPKSLLHKRPSYELVPKIREKLLNLYEFDKSFADECDINRIQSDDWSVQRFVEYYDNDFDEATDQLILNLKWRKTFGVNNRSLDRDYGREFFNIGAIFEYNEDRNGIPLLYFRGKCNRKVAKLRPLIEMFLIAIIESLDKKYGNKGFVLVLDCSDCGLNNLSMDLLKFVITSLTVHYPLVLQYVIVYNLPWLLRGIWKLVKGWLGEYQNLVEFANGDEIQKYVSIDLMPKYMGGKCDRSFIDAPDGCPTVYELAERYGFTQIEVKKYMKIYDDLLDSAKNCQ